MLYTSVKTAGLNISRCVGVSLLYLLELYLLERMTSSIYSKMDFRFQFYISRKLQGRYTHVLGSGMVCTQYQHSDLFHNQGKYFPKFKVILFITWPGHLVTGKSRIQDQF